MILSRLRMIARHRRETAANAKAAAGSPMFGIGLAIVLLAQVMKPRRGTGGQRRRARSDEQPMDGDG